MPSTNNRFRKLTGIKQFMFPPKTNSLEKKLIKRKGHQQKTFLHLRRRFPEIHNKLKAYDISRFTIPSWESFNAKFEEVFLPYPPFSFLNDPLIIETMFVTVGGDWMEKEILFLEQKISSRDLKLFLQEDYVGTPLLLNSKYLTSHTSIHHLYHLMKFIDKTQCDLSNIKTVIEWGGGYGNMAKIFSRLKANPSTYIIIDTPLFSCIQWLYLSSVLGEKNVKLLQTPEDRIDAGKINLLPLCFLNHQKLKADLFISTWALSESSQFSQDYVKDQHWFEADHLLLAYQDSSIDFPNAERIKEITTDTGAIIEDIEFLPGNHYAFR